MDGWIQMDGQTNGQIDTLTTRWNLLWSTCLYLKLTETSVLYVFVGLTETSTIVPISNFDIRITDQAPVTHNDNGSLEFSMCCRDDGNIETGMALPTTHPFILVKVK